MFSNSPEYEARLSRPFVPPKITMKQIRDAVPKYLFQKDPLRSTGFVLRDLVLCAAMFAFAAYIDRFAKTGFYGAVPVNAPWQVWMLRTALWLTYWWWQGLVFTGFFCIAHELGHGTLYHSWYANNVPGFIMGTFILLPYFSWKVTHNAHHKAVGSMERDENYVPHLRSHYKLPPPERSRTADYAEVFEETPIMTLFRMLVMQSVGWWAYLSCNAMGSSMYPEGTNHLSPYSALFKNEQRRSIMITDIGLATMASILIYFGYVYGFTSVLMYYWIPYMLCNHWIVMCTFLHHSDPSIPHYRGKEWTFLRGVLATVDRPILGWIGRFFFHNVSHDHIAHHLFSSVPFYNQPQITEAIKKILVEEYNYDSTNSFYALYRSFTECVFVEEEGDIIFYKNARGESAREVAQEAFATKEPYLPSKGSEGSETDTASSSDSEDITA